MELLKTINTKRIPALYSQEEVEDPTVYLFLRCGKAVWFITEANDEGLSFGWADLYGTGESGELGYISLEEISELASDYFIAVLEVEKPLSEMKKEIYG